MRARASWRGLLRLWPYATVAAFLITTACLLSPSLEEGLAAITAMEARGAMTPQEAAAMRDALNSAAANWWINNVVVMIGTMLGVRMTRGPARR